MNEWILEGSDQIYIQLGKKIKGKILSGTYPLASRLPSIRQIAMDAGVNNATVARAFSCLANEGLICRSRQGYTVTGDLELIHTIREKTADELAASFIFQMAQMGFSVEETMREVSYHAAVSFVRKKLSMIPTPYKDTAAYRRMPPCFFLLFLSTRNPHQLKKA